MELIPLRPPPALPRGAVHLQNSRSTHFSSAINEGNETHSMGALKRKHFCPQTTSLLGECKIASLSYLLDGSTLLRRCWKRIVLKLSFLVERTIWLTFTKRNRTENLKKRIKKKTHTHSQETRTNGWKDKKTKKKTIVSNSPDVIVSHDKGFAERLRRVEPHSGVFLHGSGQLPGDRSGAGVQGAGQGREQQFIRGRRPDT